MSPARLRFTCSEGVHSENLARTAEKKEVIAEFIKPCESFCFLTIPTSGGKKMRKLFLATALVLMVAIAVMATESAPSNTVGFIKNTTFPLGFSAFMLPFDYYQPGYTLTTSLDTIVGTQANDADEIWSQRYGWIASYFGGVWYTSGDPMLNTDAFWYSNYGSNVTVTTAGEVRTASVNYGIIPAGFTAYGLPVAQNTAYSSLELELVGLDYLELWDQNSGDITSLWMGTWYPDLDIIPANPIWLYTDIASPNAWVYDPSDDPGRGTTGATIPSRMAPIQPQSIDRAVPAINNTRSVPSRRTH